jgi:sodium-dependent dicarboxylate transporter 2/3/5
MADSRRAAERHLYKIQQVVQMQTKAIYFLVSIITAFLLTYLISNDNYTQVQTYVLFTLLLAIGLWVTEAIPPFAVGIFIVGFLIFLVGATESNTPESANYLDVRKLTNTWSNSVIWLLLGGFFLAEALKKTNLDQRMFKFTIRLFGTKPKNLLLGIMLATAIASMIMSNTAITAMMIASILPLITKLGKEAPFSKALLLGIPAAASMGGMGTLIGSPPNIIAADAINHFIENTDYTFRIGFLEWMMFGFPIAILLVLGFWFFLKYEYTAKVKVLDLDFVFEEDSESEEINLGKIYQRRITLVVLVVTILLWLTGGIHHIPPAVVSGIPIVFLTMFSIVNGDDVRKLPWDTLMLVTGGLSLGLAIKQSGLTIHFVSFFQDVHLQSWVLILIFAIATVLFSNFMSNTATVTILIPIASIIAVHAPVIMTIVIGLSASCALLFPVSTPPNAIAFGTGFLKQVDFRKGGILAGLVGPLLIMAWVFLVFYIIQ